MTSNQVAVWSLKGSLALIGAAIFFATPSRAAIGIDATVSRDQGSASTTVTTPAFSTTSGSELLLAFIATDQTSSSAIVVNSVSGAGLNWALVQRTNVQLGTAEIWSAFASAPLSSVTVTATLSQSAASSMTVMSFTGVDTSGTNGSGAIGAVGTGNNRPGAPSAMLVTTRGGSLVLGVGNDWDNSIARTLGPGQTLVHQYFPPVGDTYWVQRQTNPTPLSGTSVTINDTAPTGDRYNLSIVEVLPTTGTGGTTFNITGTVTPAASSNGATMTLTQGTTTIATTTVNSGSYTFTGISNGTYVVTPSKAGFTFSPTNQSVPVNGGNVTVPVFTATAVTFNVTGTVTPAASGSGASVALTQGTTTLATTTVDGTGSYTFTGVANGTYVVTPSKAGFTFSPVNQTVVVNGGNATVLAFTATWNISGAITPASAGMGTLVNLSGPASANVTADATGSYTFTGVANGTYVVTPSKAGFTFSPANQTVIVNGNNASVPNFAATPVPTWSISGTISPAASGSGTLLTLSGSPSSTTTADASGSYSFTALANGTYTVTPSKSGFTFTPPSQTVTISGNNAPNVNFNAQGGVQPSLLFPDLRDIIPMSAISVVGTGSSRQFQYTHDTFNGGPGPLVIKPSFNSASGNYQGTQYIYSLNSGVWSLTQQIPMAGVFIFDSDHGHFHFPFVTYGLYTVGPSGGPGTPVATSGKISFCINDSFIYAPSLPNAGALGNLGSCSDPTSLRGLNIGAVDEYDQTDAGQAIVIGNLPDGTYWLKALVDPNNFLAEADKTNNETDVELTITGNTVQVLKTVTPVLNTPPSVTLTAPSDGGTISGIAQLAASTATTSGVQFLLDGQPFGSVVTVAPYNLAWDTTTVPNGTHWLAVQTTDPTGVIGTSPVAQVTVSNTANTGPTVQLTDPATGSILSATVTLYATVASSQPIANVAFFVDFKAVGTPVTSPPYMVSWDTTTVPDGQHVVTVTATDSLGNIATSTQTTVTVDNSHPAALIGKEVSVSIDGQGALTTPLFSTSTPSDLLVAFVSYDGPSNAAQTATVSGAGLTWTLLERSNTQSGTSEIWSTRADGILSNVTVMSQPGNGSSYHGSLTVIAFTNSAGTSVVGRAGSPSGAPDILVPGVIAGDWIFAVGNDWDNPIARVPVSGQTLVHQKLDTGVGDTYWVQSTTAPSTANGLVVIHDTSPTTDQWNYAVVEIVARHQ